MAFSKFLDPKNDYLFRRLFGEERHKALNVMTQYSMTEEEWNTYQQSLKHEMDNRAAEQFKLEEAEEKGMKKGKKEIALIMIRAGESLDKVSLFTGLSMAEIQALKYSLSLSAS
jgi:hypothetical protein